MADFIETLLKIQSEYFKRRQWLYILDLISIFSIVYAIFLIFQVEFFLKESKLSLSLPINIIEIIPLVMALIIAITGAFLMHRNDRKINIALVVENKFPDLREKLRTAYDNRNETNIIVESLKTLVLSGLAVVSGSKLIESRIIITKIILVIIFISGAVFISQNPDVRIPPETIASNLKNLTGTGNGETDINIDLSGKLENIDTTGKNGSGSILGNPVIASIEGKDIDIALYSGLSSGYMVREAGQTMDQFIKSAAFPVDILGSNVSDGSYSMLMKKTATEKLLINKYAVERSKI